MQGKCYLGVHADADRDQCKEKTKQNKLTIGYGWWTRACMWICCICIVGQGIGCLCASIALSQALSRGDCEVVKDVAHVDEGVRRAMATRP